MALRNLKRCQTGINILWGLSLLPHLAFVVLLNSLERNNGYKSKGAFTAKKRIRRPGRHKKNLNKRDKPKAYYG